MTLTLNRPEKKNAITRDMWGELSEVFDEVARSRDDRVLVITGAGDAFCAGADLTDAGMPRQLRSTGSSTCAGVGRSARCAPRDPQADDRRGERRGRRRRAATSRSAATW